MMRLGTKRVALTVQLIVAIFALIASSQNWVTFTLSDETALSTRFLDVSGNTIAPLTFALLLAAVAGLGALTISNRGISYFILFAVAACGVGSSIVSVNVANDPIAFAQTQLTTATGLAGADTLNAYVVSTELSPWLVITAIASAALSVLAILAIVNVHNWTRRRTRYDSRSRRTAEASPPVDEHTKRVSVDDLADDRIDDWDALSSGEDPSATHPDSGATNPSRFD